MKFIADLHIHSHFSRATSKSLDPEHLALWAQKKGIRVVGTGDFTHPGWVSELQDKMVEAEDGLIATKKLKENKISLVVTNLRMPGLNGFELPDHIKAHYPDIPVIIITGYDSPENERLARAKGAAAYIRKPFKIEELTGAISTFLK